MSEEEKVLEKLKEVIDPELGLNVVDLGLIYEIKVEGKKVFVSMGLTTPFCPFGAILFRLVEEKIRELGYEPEVEFNPEPWSPDRLSEEAKKKLGLA